VQQYTNNIVHKISNTGGVWDRIDTVIDLESAFTRKRKRPALFFSGMK
jgi:hypothetical protein